MALQSLSQHQRYKGAGFAYLEAAIWLAVLSPLALLGAFQAGALHDRMRMNQIPISAIRQLRESAFIWHPAGPAGVLELQERALNDEVVRMVEVMLVDAEHGLAAGVKDISVRACYWVHRVDQETGELRLIEKERCLGRGELASAIDLEPAHADFQRGQMGIALPPGFGSAEYLAQRVFIGAGVGGRVRSFSNPSEGDFIQHVRIAIPRVEVSL